MLRVVRSRLDILNNNMHLLDYLFAAAPGCTNRVVSRATLPRFGMNRPEAATITRRAKHYGLYLNLLGVADLTSLNSVIFCLMIPREISYSRYTNTILSYQRVLVASFAACVPPKLHVLCSST